MTRKLTGITSYGVYVPFYRLNRGDIGTSLGLPGLTGARPVAGYDEDSTTLAVEAARRTLRRIPGFAPAELWFATSRPAYLERSNASAIAMALGLPEELAAYDAGGAIRSGAGAFRAALRAPAVVTLADLRYGLPGSEDELLGADAAAAFTTGENPVAELLGGASRTMELLDRWRTPGAIRTRTWEERFGVEEYLEVVQAVAEAAAKEAGLEPSEIDHVVISGPHTRAVREARRRFDPARLAAGLADDLGYAGTADFGVRLCAVLDRAEPGQSILAVLAADGADAFVFRATPELAAYRAQGAERPGGVLPLGYPDYLTWRGLLDREPPRRPEVKSPAPPASWRNMRWKFSFTAARCAACGIRNLPPRRICLGCGAVDQGEPVAMRDVRGTVATFTDDWLSESVQLPAKVVAVDFDGGGRFEFEMTDAPGREVAIGDRVAPVFRLASVASNDIRNYIWKVRPHEEES
ncbi:OB-fold domain-containing protein [Acrocarpospora catenulata]|uniref:OB-fold domain-containing protein n=1 Tax=Acrocarpospora catenulata TaxID=2836182 RepID=UPI001BDA086D|nr:OB-fold domain-containing protein [Acrocarpospora catenulata]